MRAVVFGNNRTRRRSASRADERINAKRKQPVPYEQSLERRDVAIRSMWRMYHGNLRKELLALGLTSDEAALAFADQPNPRTEAQVFETIQRCPAVAVAAEKLVAQYIKNEWEDRKAHYERKADA
jgi:hypothetical protein